MQQSAVRVGDHVCVEIDVDLLEIIEELGLVGPDEADDPGALSFALLMLLTEAVEARRSCFRKNP